MINFWSPFNSRMLPQLLNMSQHKNSVTDIKLWSQQKAQTLSEGSCSVAWDRAKSCFQGLTKKATTHHHFVVMRRFIWVENWHKRWWEICISSRNIRLYCRVVLVMSCILKCFHQLTIRLVFAGEPWFWRSSVLPGLTRTSYWVMRCRCIPGATFSSGLQHSDRTCASSCLECQVPPGNTTALSFLSSGQIKATEAANIFTRATFYCSVCMKELRGKEKLAL